MTRRDIVNLARQLRRAQTPSGKRLWELLRNRKLSGLKFTRQHPFVTHNVQGRMEFFIADFYCAQKKLVVELDGSIHDLQPDYDTMRDRILVEKGLRVLRIKNSELDQIEVILDKIRSPDALSLSKERVRVS
jgi:very-short-patch-repair endonuclease